MEDLVIKGRILENFATVLFIIGITIIATIFVLKYTGWLSECPVCEEEQDTQEQVYQDPVEEIPLTLNLEEPLDETIVVPETKVKVAKNEEKDDDISSQKNAVTSQVDQENKADKQESSLSLPEGQVEVTIDDIDYEKRNEGDSTSDFVKINSITISLANNNVDFFPFATVYLYDANHENYRTRYGESAYLDHSKKGKEQEYVIDINSLSLVDVDVEKTLLIRISNAADNVFIAKQEETFIP